MLPEQEKQLKTVLSGLSVPVRWISSQDAILKGIPNTKAITAWQGDLFSPLNGKEGMLCCPLDTPGGRDLLKLATALAEQILDATEKKESDENEQLLQFIQGKLKPEEMQRPINTEMGRCIIVYSCTNVSRSVAAMEADMIPLENEDILLHNGKNELVLFKTTGRSTEADIRQYVEAVQETLLYETGISAKAGIGGTVYTQEKLPESYRQAHKALKTGQLFREEEQVFSYNALFWEQLIYQLPEDTIEQYVSVLNEQVDEEFLTEDNIRMVETLIRCDLNLTDAARSLFIHRNTLVYRLDRLQEQTGFNLRLFRDALRMKLLLDCMKLHNHQLKTKRGELL